MAKASVLPRRKRRKVKLKLIVRLLVPMVALLLFQLLLLFAILAFGGEFSYVRQYSFNTLAEKTDNRKSYIETEWQQKMPLVQEAAYKINYAVNEILKETGADISDIQKKRELNSLIMESSVDNMVDMLEHSTANEVYLILETGELYRDDGYKKSVKAALYLRDTDDSADDGYEDLLMEIGPSSIAQSYGIVLDSGWTFFLEAEPGDKNYEFYFGTIKTAKENGRTSAEDLGYWSGFSQVSDSAEGSIKYTFPLIAEDGTVYGVLGMGMTEDTVLSGISAGDAVSDSDCYVLGKGIAGEENSFEILTHSGSLFDSLVGNVAVITAGEAEEEDSIYNFDLSPRVKMVGSVQFIRLYDTRSPYYGQTWALISIAERDKVLSPLTGLVQMLLLAAGVSLAVSVTVVILSCRRVVKPISAAINAMNTNNEYNKVIRFKPSNIYELDKMTDAITRLQINVQDFSSQVSQMIRIANVGLGTFMYDSDSDTVFVGQSLFKLMNFRIRQNGDAVMSRKCFLDNLENKENMLAVAEGLQMMQEVSNADYNKEYSVHQPNGTTVWMRLTLVNDKDKCVGVMQNITEAVMDKRRIEYERDYDGTTGLLNRQAYYKRIEDLFSYPEDLQIAAFVMIDLDNLKYVNDTYGHDFGDDYIKTAATTLKTFGSHGAVVSRLSGDEFNVFLYGYSSKDEIRKIIEDVRDMLLQSYCLLADGTHFKIRASMGVSWYPDNSVSYELLMKYADFAMYTIKHSTKGEIAEFDETTYEKDSLLITGVEEMNRVIDEGSVRYAFHAIVSAKTGEVYGYEALMRPQSTIFKSPMELLRTAKTGAKLYEIEKLTWHKALEDFQAQIEAGRISENSHIFINSISNCVMNSTDADTLEILYPSLLKNVILEVLEGESMNEEYNLRKLRRMKKWNALIALDDFGTGYNSEYAIITVQPDIIKIDRSIISGCDKDISRQMIINNLIRLVSTKNIMVLAEGVETEEELATVIRCGVDLIQGFYICRPVFEPMPVDPAMTERIRKLAGVEDDEE